MQKHITDIGSKLLWHQKRNIFKSTLLWCKKPSNFT